MGWTTSHVIINFLNNHYSSLFIITDFRDIESIENTERVVPFCHARWVHWQYAWCSPWLAWTSSLFGRSEKKPKKKRKITNLFIAHPIKSNQTECLIHRVIFGRGVSLFFFQVRHGVPYRTQSKLIHCLQVCKNKLDYTADLFSHPSLFLPFITPPLIGNKVCPQFLTLQGSGKFDVFA